MSRSIGYCLLISSLSIVVVISIVHPGWLSDENKFLANFVNHEFVSVAGIMLTIILGSIAHIHFALNEIERQKKKVIFPITRSNVRSSAYTLTILFIGASTIAFVKGTKIGGLTAESILNGLAMVWLLWNCLILTSIMQLIFRIVPASEE